MTIPYLGLRKGDPGRSAASGALAGALAGTVWAVWAEAQGADIEWYALVCYLGASLAIVGAGVGALYGVFTLPSRRTDRRP